MSDTAHTSPASTGPTSSGPAPATRVRGLNEDDRKTRRREQNRRAQEAHRAKRLARLKELEELVEEYEARCRAKDRQIYELQRRLYASSEPPEARGCGCAHDCFDCDQHAHADLPPRCSSATAVPVHASSILRQGPSSTGHESGEPVRMHDYAYGVHLRCSSTPRFAVDGRTLPFPHAPQLLHPLQHEAPRAHLHCHHEHKHGLPPLHVPARASTASPMPSPSSAGDKDDGQPLCVLAAAASTLERDASRSASTADEDEDMAAADVDSELAHGPAAPALLAPTPLRVSAGMPPSRMRSSSDLPPLTEPDAPRFASGVPAHASAHAHDRLPPLAQVLLYTPPGPLQQHEHRHHQHQHPLHHYHHAAAPAAVQYRA